jgi:hypothetical protein
VRIVDNKSSVNRPSNILILTHPRDDFDAMPYAIHLLMQIWQGRGLKVKVARGIHNDIDHDFLVVPHLDLTRTPEEYQHFLAQFPTVINRCVVDISKRKISRNLLTRPTDHDGPVIVKTNLNVGGESEVNSLRRNGILGRLAIAAARRMPWTYTGMLGCLDYPIYDHPSLIPRAVWRNPRLVVEKFLPERKGEFYCLRQYTFFGSREINTISMSREPIVKAQNVISREILPETPPALREIRRELAFDYGKFDYVMHDRSITLFDANRTPTYNPASKAGSPSKLIVDLAQGIDDFAQCG